MTARNIVPTQAGLAVEAFELVMQVDLALARVVNLQIARAVEDFPGGAVGALMEGSLLHQVERSRADSAEDGDDDSRSDFEDQIGTIEDELMMIEHVTTEQGERLVAAGQHLDGTSWLTTQSDLNEKGWQLQRVSTEPAHTLFAKLDKLEFFDETPRDDGDIGSGINLRRDFDGRCVGDRTFDGDMHKRSRGIDLAVVVVANHPRPAVLRSRGDGTRTGGKGVSATSPK